jgi:hypothetical protein
VPDLSAKNAKFCTMLKFPGIRYTALTIPVWVSGVHTACTYMCLASLPGSSSPFLTFNSRAWILRYFRM